MHPSSLLKQAVFRALGVSINTCLSFGPNDASEGISQSVRESTFNVIRDPTVDKQPPPQLKDEGQIMEEAQQIAQDFVSCQWGTC